jgi:hypothetical protein
MEWSPVAVMQYLSLLARVKHMLLDSWRYHLDQCDMQHSKRPWHMSGASAILLLLLLRQVGCPLLERLGYPVILVHSRPGTKVIPQVQMMAVSNNPRNNRAATVAASRVSTGVRSCDTSLLIMK